MQLILATLTTFNTKSHTSSIANKRSCTKKIPTPNPGEAVKRASEMYDSDERIKNSSL